MIQRPFVWDHRSVTAGGLAHLCSSSLSVLYFFFLAARTLSHARMQSCERQITLCPPHPPPSPDTQILTPFCTSITHYSSVMTANHPPSPFLSASVSSERTPTPTDRLIICCDRVLLSP